ncbi:MAG: hypothetical protein Ct9H300mP9_2580 [Candidatus Neomarinimicrobiota bacterium]|nr:MAG: hypothetical protein Ct9H300mP9_2580 [Candidatus Neomarinimicrobiota bacterium]
MARKGAMTGQNILAIIVFLIVFLGWVFLSKRIGAGYHSFDWRLFVSGLRLDPLVRSKSKYQLGCYPALWSGCINWTTDRKRPGRRFGSPIQR